MLPHSSRNLFAILIIISVLIDKIPNAGTSSEVKKRAVRFVPKTKHERDVLKSVADRIYGILNSGRYQNHRIERGAIASEDAGDMLASVLSMVLDRDGRAPQVESEARILETLSHFIAEESERLRKRKDTADLSPNVSSDLLRNGRKSFLDMFKFHFGATTAKPVAHNNVTAPKSFNEPLVGMSENERLGQGNEMVPDLKVESAKDIFRNIPKQGVIFTSDTQTVEEEVTTAAADPPETDESVLRLTPHVVFTDAEGREYRLIGVGGRGSADCSRQCLTVDGSSRNVLAYKKPTSASQFLVLADPGGLELFTSGVQVCDPEGSNIHGMNGAIRGPDLSLLHPKFRRSVEHEEEVKKAKRAGEVKHDEFSQEVETLYSGPGLSGRLEKKSMTNPEEVLKSVGQNNKKSRLKRHRQVSVVRRRRNKNHMGLSARRNARRLRISEGSIDGEDERFSDHAVKEASNPLQVKLMSELGKYNDNLQEYSKGGKAQIDVDRCKRHCEDMGAHIDSLADFEGAIESSRSKRAIHYDLMPRENAYIQSQNGSCTDCQPKEFMSLDSVDVNKSGENQNGYKIITFEPDNQPGESLNPPMSDEEFNMIQPTTTPDDEDKLLLQTDSQQLPTEAITDNFKKVVNWDSPKPDGKFEAEGMRHGDEVARVRADANLEWAAVPDEVPVTNGETYDTTQPSVAETWMKENFPEEVHEEPEGETIAIRLEENVKARVENSPDITRVIGPALKLIPSEIAQPTPPPMQYSSAFDILMKTFMVNVEKIAEDELAGRNCVRLSSDLQEHLSRLLVLPIRESSVAQYSENVAHVPTYQEISLRKNKLVSLLKEFSQMPPKEQMETMGVKGFLERDLESIDKVPSTVPKNDISKRSMMVIANSVSKSRGHSTTTSRPKLDEYKEAAREWLESMKKSVDLTAIRQMNPFRAKPYVDTKPFPQPDSHVPPTSAAREGALLQTGGIKGGIVVSTVAEASFFSQNGFTDILVGRPVTAHLLERCQHLVSSDLRYLVNSWEGARAVVDASCVDRPLSVLMKISGGYNRAGIPWDDQTSILDISKMLSNSSFVKFVGLYAHCGNSYTTEKSQVVQVRDETVERIVQVKKLLIAHGIACEEVGVGSTPSCSLAPSPELRQLTEIHPGNFIFYDVQQESYGACRREDIAGRVMTRVISHSPCGKQLVVDLGFTALTKQGLDLAVPGYAAIDKHPELKLTAMTQELGKIERVDGGAIERAAFPADMPIFVFPYHACASAGSHQHYYVHDDQGIVSDVWFPVRGW